MAKILKKLNVLLDKKQKKIMAGLIVIMLVGAVLETLGVGMIYPVALVITDPMAIKENAALFFAYDILNMQSTTQFTIVVMAALIVVFAVKNAYLFFQNKSQLNFVYRNQFSTSRRMMINFMKRPYEYYLNADTSIIQRSITSDVNNMYGLILSLLQLFSEIIVFVCLLAVCLVSDIIMTATIAILLIVVLLVIKGVLQPIMRKAGEDNQEYYSGLYKWIEQSVMGIKEIKVANKENYFINEYSACGKGYVNAVEKYNLYNATPRLLIETVAIAGMVLYVIIRIAGGTAVTDIMPQMMTLVVAATRLIPSANRINNYLTSISYFEPFFMGVTDNLQEEISDDNINYDEMVYLKKKEVEKLPVKKEILIKDITYKYPNSEVLIFDRATMQIPVGKSVGIVGTSGAGKTTVVDIMLGLLKLQSGGILADGVEVREHYESWLKNIGYIPQSIFMIDSTIRKNVAFGYADHDIDDAKVWQALKEAQLDEFVKGLPEGLDTEIGRASCRERV